MTTLALTGQPYSGFSVDDVPAARRFYEDVLGVQVAEAHGMLTLFPGERPTLVYPKGEEHVPASFTVLNFPVADIDAAVAALRARGVAFSASDWTDEAGIMRGRARGMGPDIAWFRDPAGNVLSVLQEG